MARLLAVKARSEIRAGKCEQAVATLCTGFALARHVAKSPLLVSGLLAIQMAELMDIQMETLVQQPGMANLCWSLAALPRPLVDPGPGFAAEEAFVSLTFPDVRNLLKSTDASPQQWSVALKTFAGRLDELADLASDSSFPNAAFLQSLAKEATFLATETVAQAKRARGRPPREVEAMSAAEVTLRNVFETYDEFRDEFFKYVNLPYWQAAPIAQRAEAALRKAIDHAELVDKPRLALPGLLLPALWATLYSHAQAQQHLDVLRCVEALRYYAAEHGGNLPASLDDIHEVPLPINPVTGQAFGYRLEGDTAVLTAGGAGRRGQPRLYRIKIAK